MKGRSLYWLFRKSWGTNIFCVTNTMQQHIELCFVLLGTYLISFLFLYECVSNIFMFLNIILYTLFLLEEGILTDWTLAEYDCWCSKNSFIILKYCRSNQSYVLQTVCARVNYFNTEQWNSVYSLRYLEGCVQILSRKTRTQWMFHAYFG